MASETLQTFAVGETIRRHHLEAVDEMTDRIASLEAEVAALREALSPFADALDDWGDEGGGGNFDIYEHPTAMNITLDHLRDARALLNRSETK